MFQRLCRAALEATSTDGLLLAMWRTGVWRLMLFLLIYSSGLAIIFPITPTLMTNGFASLAAGHRLDCSAFKPEDSPPECVDAHSTVVLWMSVTNFISSSLLTFFCAPAVGALSDRLGRKPFMLVGVGLMFLPLAVIQLHLHDVLPIYWYFPASAIGGLVSSFTMTLTSVADLMEQKHRATAVGYLTSCFSLGMLAGPFLGGYLSLTAAMWTCMALTGVTWMYVAMFVPECAPGPLARRAAAKSAAAAAVAAAAGGGKESCGDWASGGDPKGGWEADGSEGRTEAEAEALVAAQRHLIGGGSAPSAAAFDEAGAGGAGAVYGTVLSCPHARTSANGDEESAQLPYDARHRRCSGGGSAGDTNEPPALTSGWAVIRGSSFYRRIAAIWVVVSMTWEGAGELLIQYLQYKLGYDKKDQAHVFTVLASGGLVVKLGLLAALVRLLGERRLLALGLAAYAVECLALAVAPSKAAGLAAVSFGSLASVCWPALTALQTAGVHPAQQGAVFGALQAISSMASGLGPLLFAAIFRAVTRTDSRLPSMPGVVWYLAAAMTLVAIALTLSLPPKPKPQPQQRHHHGRRRGPRHAESKGEDKYGAAGGSGGGSRLDLEAAEAGGGKQENKQKEELEEELEEEEEEEERWWGRAPQVPEVLGSEEAAETAAETGAGLREPLLLRG